MVRRSYLPFLLGNLYGLFIYFLSYLFNLNLTVPWGPLSIIGIAVAFYLGFKNNSSYDRTWEARKIWGSIVNNSRTFGAGVISFVEGESQDEVRRELIYRHIAWITALRYQLRLSRRWEHTNERLNNLYRPTICEKYIKELDSELIQYISSDEIKSLEGKTNLASQILSIQSKRLQYLRNENYFEDFRHMELHRLILSFYADQGKSERIKNFPFPRQYASVAIWLTIVLCALMPFSLMDIMKDEGPWLLFLCPFFTGLIAWVFFLMEKIGDYSENPFEGTHNDVPITSISKTIEIDLREMLNDSEIPEPIEEIDGFLM